MNEKKNKNPFLSIIIPVLNNKTGLEKTLKSIFKQKFKDYEVIVIDGKSEDETFKIIKKYQKRINKVISEKDKGIYDAINKGINLSNGKYINTINANDIYFSKNSLDIVKKYFTEYNYDFLFGAVLKNKVYYKYEPKKMFWSFNFYPSHSGGFFVKKILHKKIGLYSLKYPCSSDYDFFWKMIKNYNFKGGQTSKHEIISKFAKGGFSSKYSFFEHVCEETLIRINNKQNKIFVLILFFLRCFRHFQKI
jgi:glycosyltransferase involved in cell wall biosynthesis